MVDVMLYYIWISNSGNYQDSKISQALEPGTILPAAAKHYQFTAATT
jgi:hypothetical protein